MDILNIQALISTMDQTDFSLLEKMNIQTDAIVINQCDRNYIKKFKYKDKNISFFSFNERGVGLSRNNALMRATADIVIFADDDMEYVDNYEEIILSEFINNPEADMILFNVPSTNRSRPTYQIEKKSRVRWFNSLRYGAVKIAVKTAEIRKSNVFFSLLFGGGAKYSAGEDSLFIAECLSKGLKIYTTPKIIGYVSQESSSWFEGYTDKFFIDKGAFFASLSGNLSYLLSIPFILKNKKKWKKTVSIRKAYKLMKQGIREFKYKKVVNV